VKLNEWNAYEIIARGGVTMHIMNRQLMAVFIDCWQSNGRHHSRLFWLCHGICFPHQSDPDRLSAPINAFVSGFPVHHPCVI
jgi:hypothetical protein